MKGHESGSAFRTVTLQLGALSKAKFGTSEASEADVGVPQANRALGALFGINLQHDCASGTSDSAAISTVSPCHAIKLR